MAYNQGRGGALWPQNKMKRSPQFAQNADYRRHALCLGCDNVASVPPSAIDRQAAGDVYTRPGERSSASPAASLADSAEPAINITRRFPWPAHKAVVVHAGARDAYQLALALAERGLLDRLVTDLFWPADLRLANDAARFVPALHRQALQRSAAGLPFENVQLHPGHGLLTLLAEKIRSLPPEMRRRLHRSADAALGRAAGRRAAKAHAGLVSYSYYGFDAMRQYGGPAMLFQVHPHPATVRRLLQQELEAHPDCAESLQQEWELALPEQDFEHLVAETRMASRFLAASSFTRSSLLENGASPDAISVVPYGVDLERFHPAPEPSAAAQNRPLQLLFVGRINQRKGVKYLLESLKNFSPRDVRLTVCGRVVDSLSLFRASGLEIDLRPFVSGDDLVRAYQSADLFVFPSVAEGFAQVLLESLACGLPILSTTHTAAPDLITEGVEGFIVEPRRPDLLAQRIAWCLDNRPTLAAMKRQARLTAEQFTWARFRALAADAVGSYLEEMS